VQNFREIRLDELPRIPNMRLSEKSRRRLQRSLTKHLNGTFRLILASFRLPNPHSECCPYPFSDSLYANFAITEFSKVRCESFESNSRTLSANSQEVSQKGQKWMYGLSEFIGNSSGVGTNAGLHGIRAL
jgi:hypothetical protein